MYCLDANMPDRVTLIQTFGGREADGGSHLSREAGAFRWIATDVLRPSPPRSATIESDQVMN